MPMIRRVGRPGLIGMAARTAVVAGTATAVSGNVQRRQDQRAQAEAAQAQAVQAQQAAAPDAAPDVTAQLQQLAALHAQGVLTDAEFSAAKAKLLG
jgi:membrane protease subunit (stomatin/prohibitin family)